MIQVLNDLFARAGASDTNRAEWKAERNTGITATQVRGLANREISSDSLAAQKLGWEPEGEISSLPRIDWGNEREVVILKDMAKAGFAAETRVFHHAENTRYLASPDGLCVDSDGRLLLVEVKTDEHGIAENDELWAKTGYADQAQWQMFVTGAVETVFAIEDCINDGGNQYRFGELRFRRIARDEERIAELRAIADAFLAKLDDYAKHGRPAAGMALIADAIAKKTAAEVARQAAEDWFASTGTDSLKVPGIGSASYGVSAPRKSLDQAGLKAAHPALVEEFMQVSAASKPTFRLTPARVKKEAE